MPLSTVLPLLAAAAALTAPGWGQEAAQPGQTCGVAPNAAVQAQDRMVAAANPLATAARSAPARC